MPTIPRKQIKSAKLLSQIIFMLLFYFYYFSVYAKTPLNFTVTKQLYSKSFKTKYSRLKFAFSPDYKRFAYGALMSQKDRYAVIVGESGKNKKVLKSFKQFNGIRGELRFSPNGKRLAYLAYTRGGYTQSEAECFLVLDGKELHKYSDVFMFGFKFSPDSKRYAFIAGAYAYGKKNKNIVVVDGKDYGPYDSVDSVSFSRDSKSFSFRASDDNKWFIVVNGKKGKSYSFVSEPRFSKDSRNILYVATVPGKNQMIVVNGKEGRQYKYIGAILSAPNSKSIAFSASSDRGAFVILNGRESKVYSNSSIRHLVFSHNSKRFAFAVNSNIGYKVFTVVDNVEGPVIPGFVFDYPIFSPNDKRLAFIVMEIKKPGYVVVDGKRLSVGKFSNSADIAPYMQLVFSPDSKRLSYRMGRISRQYLVVDGKMHTKYEQLSAQVFSPDGRLIVYIASKAKKDYLVINRKQIGPFNLIHGKQDKFSNYFGRGKTLFKVKYPYTANNYIRFIDNNKIRIFTKEKNGDVYKVIINVNK